MRRTLTIFSLSLTAVLPAPVAAQTILLESDIWCPHTCAPDSAKPGYMIEIARAVFETRGQKVQYRVAPWPRAVANAVKGETDGAVGATRDDSGGLLLPAQPQGVTGNAVLVRNDAPWPWTGLTALAGKRVGITKDYSYGAEIDAWLAANPARIEAVGGETPTENNLRKLAAGRIDVVIEDAAVARYTLAQMKMDGAVRILHQDKAAPIFIAFTPANPKGGQYAKSLAEGMGELRQSGRLSAILAKYGLADWQ
ncbi:MAG: ABC transporter substrate-binding [Rhodospirillaceae bacterium]|nr:MAG: ABC transporter substrate-binding [Rhodospirillaceae bacterium]TNC96418.1 MAG: ABC transporter substrate-binding protein [Stygiobacter sp.]